MIEKIFKLIDESGKSDYRLEILMGLKKGTISNWRIGRAKYPSFEAIIKIADFFNISIDELVGRTVSEKQPTEIELLIAKLKPEQLKKVEGYIHGILDGSK